LIFALKVTLVLKDEFQFLESYQRIDFLISKLFWFLNLVFFSFFYDYQTTRNYFNQYFFGVTQD